MELDKAGISVAQYWTVHHLRLILSSR